jgi:hypothetical protein
MDQNFSNILDIFRRLDESGGADKWRQHLDQKAQGREEFQKSIAELPWEERMRAIRDRIEKNLKPDEVDEDTMAAAETHSSGPEFTGYWKGTDRGTPGNKMVGGCEESKELSFEEELMAEWDQYLEEIGPVGAVGVGGATANTNANGANTADAAVAAGIAKTNLNKLSQLGINPAQATKAIATIDADPNKPLGSTDLKQTKTLTDLVGNALSDPQKGSQLSTILQQVAKGK